MNARRIRYALALFILTPTVGALAADKDNYGDPLPKGAKARIGTARLRIVPFSSPVLTPDGKALYAQTLSGLARLAPATGAVQGKVPAEFFGVPAAVSSDDKRALYVGFDRVSVLDTSTGKTVAKVERRLPSSDASAALSADGKTLALGGLGNREKKENASILLWDVPNDKELKKITVPLNEFVAVALAGDGKTFASWGSHYDPNAKEPTDPDKNPTRVVTFWNIDGKELSKFRVDGYAPMAVAFSSDGSIAAVSNSSNSSINLVDPKSGASKQLLLGRGGVGRWLTFNPTGATVASTSDNGTVQLWKVADGVPLSTTEPPTTDLVRARVRLLDKDHGLAWATRGAEVVIWEVPSGKVLSPQGGNTNAVRTVVVTPDSKFVVTSADDGRTRKWELATGKPAGMVTFHSPYTQYGSILPPAIFSPDLSRALVRDNAGFGVYDATRGTEQYVIPIPVDGFSTPAFSPDSSKVVIASNSYNPRKRPARIAVWDVATTKRLVSVELPGIGIVAAAITPDGKQLIAAGRTQPEKGNGEFQVTVWDVAGGKKQAQYTEEAGFSQPAVATAMDNKSAVVFTSKGTLTTFDLSTGKLGKSFDLERRSPIVPPVFSRDGKLVAVACQPNFSTGQAPILVLDWESGKIRHTFTNSAAPTSLAFSPDGKFLVTGSADTTATVWNLDK